MKQFITLLILVHLIIIAACNTTSNNDNNIVEVPALQGEWEMLEVHWKSDTVTYSIEEAQPGLLIISPNRYAIMWTPTQAPRIPFKELAKPTDEELMAGFRSIVFNAGTYQLTDSTLFTTAQIAKVPGFEGGQQFYNYKIKNDTLNLVMYDET